MTHEFQDETISTAREIESLRQYEAELDHNARYELAHRYAPEGFDFYAQYEYDEEQ
jgi:hypothetical protein